MRRILVYYFLIYTEKISQILASLLCILSNKRKCPLCHHAFWQRFLFFSPLNCQWLHNLLHLREFYTSYLFSFIVTTERLVHLLFNVGEITLKWPKESETDIVNDKFTFVIERTQVTLSQIVIQSAKVMIGLYYSIWLVELLDRICEEANTEAGVRNQKVTSRVELVRFWF